MRRASLREGHDANSYMGYGRVERAREDGGGPRDCVDKRGSELVR